jgi:hypothetical protein
VDDTGLAADLHSLAQAHVGETIVDQPRHLLAEPIASAMCPPAPTDVLVDLIIIDPPEGSSRA